MAQKKASSSRCLGFTFGMWNIEDCTTHHQHLASDLEPNVAWIRSPYQRISKVYSGRTLQHFEPGKPAVPKGKADKVGAFSGNCVEFLLFSWPWSYSGL